MRVMLRFLALPCLVFWFAAGCGGGPPVSKSPGALGQSAADDGNNNGNNDNGQNDQCEEQGNHDGNHEGCACTFGPKCGPGGACPTGERCCNGCCQPGGLLCRPAVP